MKLRDHQHNSNQLTTCGCRLPKTQQQRKKRTPVLQYLIVTLLNVWLGLNHHALYGDYTQYVSEWVCMYFWDRCYSKNRRKFCRFRVRTWNETRKRKDSKQKKTKRNSLSKCYMCVKIIKEHKQMRFMIEHSLTYSVVAYVRAIYHNSRLRNCLNCLFWRVWGQLN